jgi:hypothetical protein
LNSSLLHPGTLFLELRSLILRVWTISWSHATSRWAT